MDVLGRSGHFNHQGQKLQWTKENKLQFLHLTMERMEVSWSKAQENGSFLVRCSRECKCIGDKFHRFFRLPNVNILQFIKSCVAESEKNEKVKVSPQLKSGESMFKEVCCSKRRYWLS